MVKQGCVQFGSLAQSQRESIILLFPLHSSTYVFNNSFLGREMRSAFMHWKKR